MLTSFFSSINAIKDVRMLLVYCGGDEEEDDDEKLGKRGERERENEKTREKDKDMQQSYASIGINTIYL